MGQRFNVLGQKCLLMPIVGQISHIHGCSITPQQIQCQAAMWKHVFKIARTLYPALPFLLGPVILGLPIDYFQLPITLRALIYYWIIFLTWAIARSLAFKVLQRKVSGQYQASTFRSFLPFLGFVLLTLGGMTLLTLLRSLVSEEVFLIIFALLGLVALKDALAKREKYDGAALCAFLASSAAGAASLGITGDTLHWQYAGIAFSLASLTTAAFISETGMPVITRNVRTLKLLFFAGPTFVATLAYLRQLPPIYLLSFAILPLAAKLNNLLSTKSERELENILPIASSGLCLLLFAIFALLRFT